MRNVKHNPKEPRERILEAGALLFAKKGYAAVSVREIAEAADVNVAMISYYFAGKAGVLKEIILRYFDDVQAIFDKIWSRQLSSEVALKTFVNELVEVMKNKTIFCKVAITEMPFNLPEFSEFKAEVARRHVDYTRQGLQLFKLFVEDERLNSIIAPAAISLIFSHFLFLPFIEKVWNVEINDEYYDLYAKTISTLLFDGLNGIKSSFQNHTGDVK
ncbi:MAG: TetR/AcrR family transcriptional regulator [Candidatus Kapaibacteriota bacterium]